MFCWIVYIWDIKWTGFSSKDYNVGTYRINKIFLSCKNNKKYILEDGYGRLSVFHKSTR